MNRQTGFTMVEMMAVLAVITILALMAIPSYLDRVVKAQIEAALPLADIARKPVATFWAATETWPPDNAAAGLPVADKIVNNYVSALTVQEGVIHLTFGNRASRSLAGKTLSLRPAVVPDEPIVPVVWICAQGDVPDKMTVVGQDRTDIEPLFLPLECRSLKKAG